MARITVLSTDGQERPLILPDRCARMLALMHGAISKPDAGRARALEVARLMQVDMLRGTLATHAVALSAMTVATEILSLPRESIFDTIELDYVCELAGAIEPLWETLHVVALDAFSDVGLPQSLPDPVGACGSAHLAVRAVFSDMRDRAAPIFQEHGLVVTGEPWEAVAQRLREREEQLLASVFERLDAHYDQSLVRRWSGWRTLERVLVAEVAGAARAGLIPAEGGGELDQRRFETAIEVVLHEQREAERQYLLSRWRTLASTVRHIRVVGPHLPSLSADRGRIDGLATLTAEVLTLAIDPKTEAAALLELLDVLRELQGLAVRHRLMVEQSRIPEHDADFVECVRKVVTETLPRVLRAATMEVDCLSLRQAPPPITAPKPDAGAPSGPAEGVSHRMERRKKSNGAGGLPVRNGARPSAKAIDAAAKQILQDALEAAKEAGTPYLPSREEVAAAVSKSMNYEIGIETLFGTTERNGRRVFRHPRFMELWNQVQRASQDAKRQHEAGE